jgi:hypothetical protein
MNQLRSEHSVTHCFHSFFNSALEEEFVISTVGRPLEGHVDALRWAEVQRSGEICGRVADETDRRLANG